MFPFFAYDEPVFRPPAEAFSLILQATIGCSHNRCRFCGMYKSKRFRLRPLPELLEELEAVPVRHRAGLRRLFLGDGDGLIYPQGDLERLLAALSEIFPNLARVAAYASPASLETKSVAELERLRTGKLRLLYFGLESGDDKTLESAGKGFTAEEMLMQCRKAQEAGIKLSVTAILGLAGKQRSAEHAAATAAWINALSPRYFSLLTLIRGGNEDYFSFIEPLANGAILEEALALVTALEPRATILRSDHVSNLLHLSGSYPKDREGIIAQARAALAEGRRHPGWFN
ncbi:MAG: radical SAM protein [Deltaproteobacteria bacterium]|nr:radical SAM protein [Deltaproteobacteria bacterium]